MCRGVLLELLNERPGSPALVPVLQEVLYGDGDCDSLFDMTRGKVLLLFNDEWRILIGYGKGLILAFL